MSTPDHDQQVGLRLREIREAFKLSQPQMAEQLGVSLSAFQNYERGGRSITKDLMLALNRRFDVDPTWLLTGYGFQPKEKSEIDDALFIKVVDALKSEKSAIRKLDDWHKFAGFAAAIYNNVVREEPNRRDEQIQASLVRLNEFISANSAQQLLAWITAEEKMALDPSRAKALAEGRQLAEEMLGGAAGQSLAASPVSDEAATAGQKQVAPSADRETPKGKKGT